MQPMKTEGGTKYPKTAYLVVEDPDKPTTWHMRWADENGKPDRVQCGQAWAALHGGYRGNKYAGPNADEALQKLIAIYKDQGWPLPDESKSGLDDDAEIKDLDVPMEEIEYKAMSFEMVSDDTLGPNEFKGYVSVFNTVDAHGDVILPGAFKSALPDFLENGHIYLEHDWRYGGEPIGRPVNAHEDAKGLMLHGRISETPKGLTALTLLRDKVIKRLSVGYKPDKSATRYLTHAEGKALWGEAGYKTIFDTLPPRRPRVRALGAFKSLFDGSLVARPSNGSAHILSVKSGLPAGLPFHDRFETTLAVVDEVIEDFRDIAELRVKSGRVLSAMNRGRMQTLHESLTKMHGTLGDHLQELSDLLAATDPEQKALEEEAETKALREQAEQTHLLFLEWQARRAGVLTT